MLMIWFQEASHIVQAPITIQHITATRFMLWQDGNHGNQTDTEDEGRNVLNKTAVGQEIVGR